MTEKTRSGGRTRNALTSGESTVDRDLVVTATAPGLGTLYLTYFTADKSETTGNVRMLTGGTAAAGLTLARIGLYLIGPAGAGTLVAATANDTAAFGSTFSAYSKAWAASVRKQAGQRYAVGVLVTGTTAPALYGLLSVTPAECAIAPRTSGRLSAQTDLPTTFTDASLSTANQRFYAALLP